MTKLIPLILALIANVFGLSEDMRDPAAWALSTGALGGVVWAIVAYLRNGPLKDKLDGVAVTFAAVGIGAVISLALGFGGYDGVGATVLEWLTFGVAAGFGSTLIDEAARRALGKSSPAPSTED